MFRNLILNTRLQSTRKFYQVLATEPETEQLPKIPEQVILSKYIKEYKQQQQKDSDEMTFVNWKSAKEISSQIKTYQQLLKSNPYGSIKTIEYKGHNLTLVSTNYHRINQKKLYNFLYSHKPDAIMVQRRPEYYLHDFQLLKKGPDGIFNDKAYIQQLKVTSSQLKFQNNQTNTSRPLVKALNTKRNDILEKHPNKQILQEHGFQMCKNYISLYNSTDLYLGQIPSRSFRQWIANKNTLMQLQQMFKNIARRLPRYKNLKLTPYQLGTLMYPDTFLKINDLYMAITLQMMISLKKYKNIVGIFGIMQNQAIMSLMQTREALSTPIIELLIAPKPRGTIVRNIEALEIIQKHILLDVLFYGDEVQDIETKYLHVTNSIISAYGKDLDRQTIMKFRYDKSTQYINLLKQKFKEGQQQIKKQFVRETLRN